MKKRLQKNLSQVVMTLFLCMAFSISWGQSIFTNPITDSNPSSSNPYTAGQTVNANISVSGIGRGSGISATSASNRYNASGWNTGSSILTTDYFEFTITPNSGYKINFVSFVYTGQKSSTGPSSYAFRSSVDNYTANIGSPSTSGATISLSATAYQNITSAITFRFYGWNAGGGSGTFSINDFTFNGTVSAAASIPTVTTTQILTTDITTNSAISGGNVTSAGGASTTRGVVWNTSANPTTALSTKTNNGSSTSTGTFTSNITSLNSNTLYYYRAYASNTAGTAYGTQYSFYTHSIAPGTPLVTNATFNSLDVTLDANGNNATTQYAIRINGTNFIDASGNVSATEVWQTAAAWSTVTINGLDEETTYSFDVKARNSANVETAYSTAAEGATLSAAAPYFTLNESSLNFDSLCINDSSDGYFTFSGENFSTNATINVNAQTGFSYSLTEGSGYANTLSITNYNGGQVTVWVRFSPTVAQNYDNTINLSGTGADAEATLDVVATAEGINTPASVTTGGVSGITITSATLTGNASEGGCSAITAYGIEYSLTNGFTGGEGTQAESNNISGTGFTVSLSGLMPGTTYYYRAYATDGAGTTYGNQSSFTTSGLDTPVTIAATDTTINEFTANWTAVEAADGYYLDISLNNNFTEYAYGTEIIISEYIEGDSNNKYIELYNGTASSVNLSSYQLSLYSNGASAPTQSMTLSGILPSGSTVVYKNSSANAYSGPTISNSTVINFNGNDPIGLFKNGVLIDVVGTIGNSSNFAADRTLIRKPTVVGPSTTYNTSEWTNTSYNYSNLGMHTYNGGTQPSFITGYNGLDVGNVTSHTVTGLESGTIYYYRVRAYSTNSTSANSNITSVMTECDVIALPTADTQEFCENAGATVANLTVTSGEMPQWYANETGGAVLASNTVLTAGTYYVSQTVGLCESERLAVEVVMIPTPVSPTASDLEFCGSVTVADLTVDSGESPKWYAAATGGTALTSGTTIYSTGTYYVSQTVDGCEGGRTPVIVTIKDVPVSPTAEAQTFCGSLNTIADLVVTAPENPAYTEDFTSLAAGTNNGDFDLSLGTWSLQNIEETSGILTFNTTTPSNAEIITPAFDGIDSITFNAMSLNGDSSIDIYKIVDGSESFLTTITTTQSNDINDNNSYNSYTIDISDLSSNIQIRLVNSSNADEASNNEVIKNIVIYGYYDFTNSWYNVATGGTALSNSTSLTEGTYYVSQTINGCESPRTAVAVTINPNSWTGAQDNDWNNPLNWCAGIPAITDPVSIDAQSNMPVITSGSNIEVESIVLLSGGSLTVNSGANLTVTNTVSVASDAIFTLENNAHLIQINDVANTGNITVEKASSPLYRLDYTIWSSPVRGQNLQEFSPMTLANRFYDYDESTDLYQNIDPVANDFEAGMGYLIRMPNDHPAFVDAGTPGTAWTGSFVGIPNNGTITLPMETAFNGYNLVGNPYPSPINIHDFYNANAASLNGSSALYFWRKRNDPDATTYCTVTMAAYTANSQAGGWGDTGSGTFVGDPSAWVINPGQGFFVQASGNSLVFNNEMRVNVNNGQFFRMSPEDVNNGLDISRWWINLTGNSGEFSQMAVAYSDVTTNGLDYGWDGKALTDDGLVKVYSALEEHKLAIQARESFVDTDVVALGYRVNEAGSYTISLDHTDGLFMEGQDIFLTDNVTGETVNLWDIDYMFASEAGEFNDRFVVTYNFMPLGNPDFELNNSNVIVSTNEGVITVTSKNLEMSDVNIYDVRGRLLFTQSGINASQFTIDSLQSQQQMLIVNVTTDKGTVSKKIVF